MEQGEPVPVTSLSVNELDRLRTTLQSDVEHLLDSHSALGRATARTEAARQAVGTLAKSQPGQYCSCILLHMHHVT
jgi:hypothetical protein